MLRSESDTVLKTTAALAVTAFLFAGVTLAEGEVRVRAKVTDEEGKGLLAIGDPLLSTSVHQYLMSDLDYEEENLRHTYDVKPRDLVTLNLDLRQMGVGGDDSWGAKPHPPYMIPAQEYSYSFWLRPIAPEDGEVSVLARAKQP